MSRRPSLDNEKAGSFPAYHLALADDRHVGDEVCREGADVHVC